MIMEIEKDELNMSNQSVKSNNSDKAGSSSTSSMSE